MTAGTLMTAHLMYNLTVGAGVPFEQATQSRCLAVSDLEQGCC